MPGTHPGGKALAESRRRLSQRDQGAVTLEPCLMVTSGELLPAQPRPVERLERARIRHIRRRPAEVAELSAPAGADGLLQLGITEFGEVLERRARRPFLPLKDQRNERREQREGGGHACAPGADDMA